MSFEVTDLKPFGVSVQPGRAAMDIGDLPIARLRELVWQHHLVALRGFSAFRSAQALATYCGRFGKVSVWPFGEVLELAQQESPADHIFDNNYVPLHWDGMYRPQVPELQVFQCVRAPLANQGGRTTFSNTVIALERANPGVREVWQSVTGVYSRKMEFYDSRTVAPIITKHPARGFPVIRYCEPPRQDDDSFVNHPTIAFSGIPESEIDAFHRNLRQALYSPEALYAHVWRTDDIVIADNYTLLHGREAFTSGAPRRLRRVHVLGDPPLDNPHLVAYS